ncbi:MAG: biotin--[acetyl-CoA-carboxylase] ligase [Phycisphaerae bacterium]|jgi:BirA family biotin operon repressor/biotin-[acetyl-CoA-carboxylase] ligase
MQARLTAENLFPDGPLRRLGWHVDVFDEVDSTNAYLLARAGDLPDGAVACAEFQHAGRGRLGRRWEAPRGGSVLLSVLLKGPATSPLLRQATLLGAVAACEAIEATTDCRPVLRWPNDLMIGGRKIGGVLVESTTVGGAAQRAVVLGIGVNCLQQRAHFAGPLADVATSLEIESPHAIDRLAVARGLLARLDERLCVDADEVAVMAEVLAAWKGRCDDVGRRVRLQHDRRTQSGTVLDISEDGDLLVQLDDGGRRYFASAATTRLV